MKIRIAYIGSLLILAGVVLIGLARTEIRKTLDGPETRRTGQEVQLLERSGSWVLQINLRNDREDAATYRVTMRYAGAETFSEFWITPGRNAVFTRHNLQSGQMDISIIREGNERVVLDQFLLRIPEAATSNSNFPWTADAPLAARMTGAGEQP